jgi:hypothetical protein
MSPIFGNDEVFGKFQTSGNIDFSQKQIFWKNSFKCGPEMEFLGKITMEKGKNYAEGEWTMEVRSAGLKRKMRQLTGIRLGKGEGRIGGGWKLVNDWTGLFGWWEGGFGEGREEEAGGLVGGEGECGEGGEGGRESLLGKFESDGLK